MYRASNSMCNWPATFFMPFFNDNYGPRYMEIAINAHESRPGHHTQVITTVQLGSCQYNIISQGPCQYNLIPQRSCQYNIISRDICQYNITPRCPCQYNIFSRGLYQYNITPIVPKVSAYERFGCS